MDTKTTLLALANTLNQIDVHGEENLDRLLSCIRAAKALAEAVPESGTEEDEHGDDDN